MHVVALLSSAFRQRSSLQGCLWPGSGRPGWKDSSAHQPSDVVSNTAAWPGGTSARDRGVGNGTTTGSTPAASSCPPSSHSGIPRGGHTVERPHSPPPRQFRISTRHGEGDKEASLSPRKAYHPHALEGKLRTNKQVKFRATGSPDCPGAHNSCCMVSGAPWSWLGVGARRRALGS